MSLGIALPHPEQVQLLGQQVDFVLFLSSELVVRFLHEFKLFCHDLKLALLLLSFHLQSCGLVTGILKLGIRGAEFRVKKLLFLAKVLDLTLELVNLVGQVVILTLYHNVQVLLFKGLLLETFIADSIRLVLFHHHIMIALE